MKKKTLKELFKALGICFRILYVTWTMLLFKRYRDVSVDEKAMERIDALMHELKEMGWE